MDKFDKLQYDRKTGKQSTFY